MDEFDTVVFECVKISNGTRNDVFLKNSLLDIAIMKYQPILKCGKMHVILDGQATAYTYEDK
jgi:hypothetical protein